MKHFTRAMLPFGLIAVVAGLILFSETVIPVTANTVSVCITSIIPSLFPFFVCSKILLEYKVCEVIGKFVGKPFQTIFRLPADFAGCFLLGCVCGFPSGARISAELYSTNRCTKRQAVIGSVLCNNAGPLFIVGTLGTTLLKNAEVGRILWGIHILSAIFATLLLRTFLPLPSAYETVQYNKTRRSFSVVFTDAVSESVTLVLQICGLVIFFGAIIQTLICFGLPQNSLIIGCIEMTTGLIYATKEADLYLFPILSFLLGFGGLSVFMQVSMFFTPCRLPVFPYLIGKIIQGGISATLTYLYFILFPFSIETAATVPLRINQTPTLTVFSLALLLAYGCKRKITRDSP